jgi:hypothetical protein
MQEPAQILFAEAVNAATGGPATGVESVISSTAKLGSVPTPSTSFTQRKPILTLGLLLAEAGNKMEKAVHLPCPPLQTVVFARGSICAQVTPLKYNKVASSWVPCPFSMYKKESVIFDCPVQLITGLSMRRSVRGEPPPQRLKLHAS